MSELFFLTSFFYLMVLEREVIKLVGAKIREKRIEKGMSQEVLSFDANIPKNQVGRIERGEINPTLITLNKISLALEIPLKDLFEF